MSASLARLDINVDNPKVNATGVQASSKARSSVEVKNSCNCFKNCFPCFGSKEKDAYEEQQEKTKELARKSFSSAEIHPDPRRMVRSPGFDPLPIIKSEDMTEFRPMPIVHHVEMTHSVAINVQCDHSPGTSPQSPSPLSTDSVDSISGD